MKALFAQKALYSASPILPQAAFPALPARGGAAGRQTSWRGCYVENGGPNGGPDAG
jgi:hypothetical protein